MMLAMFVCVVVFTFSAFAADEVASGTYRGNILCFSGGSGTEDSPYLISTAEHLNNIRLYPSAHFELTNDIYFTSQDFTYSGDFYNSGSYWDPIDNFTGSFNGNNYVIDGLKMKRSFSGEKIDNVVHTGAYFGLFAKAEGNISNLTLSNINIQINVRKGFNSEISVYVGGLAGCSNGKISNCTVSGTIGVTGNTDIVSATVGGVVGQGYTNCSIVNSGNNASIKAVCTQSTYQYGSGAYISSSTATAGGIAGKFSGKTISDCINFGTITANSIKSPYAGGIIGKSSTNGIDGNINTQISGCYNYGNVEANSNPPAKLEQDDYNYGRLTAKAGGIIAYMIETAVGECGNYASVTAKGWGADAGGIAGYAYYTGNKITQCFNKGNILSYDLYTTHYGSHHAGGITAYGGLIDQSYNEGSVTSTGTDYVKAGGITVCTFDKITNCYNAGTISAQTDAYESCVAGIIVDLPTAIEYCYNIGTLEGAKKGGIARVVYDGTANSETERHILDCYYIDNVSVGIYETIDYCAKNVYQKSASQLKNKSTFLHFDFEEIWTFFDGNYPYPQLIKMNQGLAYSVNDDGITCIITDMGFCTETELVLPNEIDEYRVTAIGNSAFYGCTNLKQIVIPDSVTSIYSWAFRSCSGLTSITFSGDAPTFDTNAFRDVTATVYYPANNPTWTEAVRQNYGGNITWVAVGPPAYTLSPDGSTLTVTVQPHDSYESGSCVLAVYRDGRMVGVDCVQADWTQPVTLSAACAGSGELTVKLLLLDGDMAPYLPVVPVEPALA